MRDAGGEAVQPNSATRRSRHQVGWLSEPTRSGRSPELRIRGSCTHVTTQDACERDSHASACTGIARRLRGIDGLRRVRRSRLGGAAADHRQGRPARCGPSVHLVRRTAPLATSWSRRSRSPAAELPARRLHGSNGSRATSPRIPPRQSSRRGTAGSHRRSTSRVPRGKEFANCRALDSRSIQIWHLSRPSMSCRRCLTALSRSGASTSRFRWSGRATGT